MVSNVIYIKTFFFFNSFFLMHCSWNFQHLAESLRSLFKEKESLLEDYDCLKVKLAEEYEQQQKLRSSYQREAEALYEVNSKIKAYTSEP